MWPWEHLAFGYLLTSLYFRSVHRRAPRTAEFVAVAFGTQFPDVVDKPLAWSLGALPSGTSLAHSVFVAVPLVVFVWLVAASVGRGSVATAFGLGYLSHLPGDVFYGTLVYGRDPAYAAVLWPLVATTQTEAMGFLTNFSYYFAQYEAFVTTPAGQWYVLAQIVGSTAIVGLWFFDGAPGLTPMVQRLVK